MPPLSTQTTPAPTPNLDRLLRRLGATLTRNIWLHGLGTVIAAAALWLTYMYVADRMLKLPAAVRVIHLLALVGGTAWLLKRSLFLHAGRVPNRAGLAMLAQRALPDDVPHDDRFVSAIQLRETVAAGDPSASLVQRVAREAEAAVGQVDLARVTNSRGPMGRVAAGLVAATVAGGVLGYQPAMASIFGQRILGQNVSWPRATTLTLDVPAGTGGLDVVRPSIDRIHVRAARGSDVPLLILAEGVVPDLVTIKFASGAAIDLSPTAKDKFRTILPSVQEDISLQVYGGDDQRGAQVVEVEVLQPPDLAGLAFEIQPPAYSGLPQRTEHGTSVAVLAGSTVRVFAQTDPENATGLARTFPNDEEIALTRLPFPLANQQPATADGGAAELAPAEHAPTALTFERTMNESLRFRVELTDDTGLRNPDPALFGIEVVPDRRPELVTLEPGRAEVETITGGAIPLRVLVRDDFGLDAFRYEVRDVTTEVVLSNSPLPLTEMSSSLEGESRSVRATALAAALLEVGSLRPGSSMEEGQVVVLQSFVTDARYPEPNETRSAPIRIRVVSSDEFLRRQRDGLGRAAEDIGRVISRLSTTLARMDEHTMAMDGDEAEAPESSDVTALLNNARRTQGDLTTVSRDLSGLASSMIYSRMDDRSGALEARLLELSAGGTDRSFHADVWRAVCQEAAAGQLGSPERAGELVRLVGMALHSAESESDGLLAALEDLAGASEAPKPLVASRAALKQASSRARTLRQSIEALMEELGEWDNMQAIISLTRDIANRQKNILEKIRAGADSEK